MDDVNKDVEVLRKSQKEMLEIKTVTGGLINRLHTAEERPPELHAVSIEFTKSKKQRKKKLKKAKQNILNYGTATKM